MHWMLKIQQYRDRSRSLVCLAALVVASGAAAAPAWAQAPTSQTGGWTAELSDSTDELRLEMQLGGRSDHFGVDVSLAEVAGLSADDVAGSMKEVRFRLVRPAGTVTFDGSVGESRGRGTYRFVADRAYAEEIGRLYEHPEDSELLTLAMLEVDLAFAREAATMAAGMDVEALVKASIFGVTRAFAAEMRAAGLDDLELEDLVQLRIFEVDRALVAELARMGYDDLDVEDLVKVQVHDVDPDFVRDVRALGYEATLDELVQMQIFGIDADFVREMAGVGYGEVSVEELVQLRIFDIDAAYVRHLDRAGLGHPPVEELVRRKIFDVDVEVDVR